MYLGWIPNAISLLRIALIVPILMLILRGESGVPVEVMESKHVDRFDFLVDGHDFSSRIRFKAAMSGSMVMRSTPWYTAATPPQTI